jgi:acetyl esterase/lipase
MRCLRLMVYRRIYSMPLDALKSWLSANATTRGGAVPAYMRLRFKVSDQEIAGCPCPVIEPFGGAREGAPKILFLHGGGFLFEAKFPHWLAVERIIAKTGAQVWFAVYPLLPQGTIYEARDMVMAAWLRMRERFGARDVTVMGDSAGAVLALILARDLLLAGEEQPRQLILVSPGQSIIDDEQLLAEMRAIAPHDPMLSFALLDNLNALIAARPGCPDYVMRPLEGDCKGFPPTALFSGTNEIFFPQALRLAQRLLDANALADFVIGEQMCHVWPYVPLAPEATRALRRITELTAGR